MSLLISVGSDIVCYDVVWDNDCGQGKVHKFHWADFGQHDLSICTTFGDWSELGYWCGDANFTLTRMDEICGGNQKCWLKAAASTFKDTCPSWREYLQFNYSCIPGEYG